MAIVSPEKIFIDPKDEITFVVERVMSSDKDRVIIVVPQNSLLLSSVISVNILYRSLLESKKVGVVVTEDDYGRMIAEKVGFNVAPKVSQITPEVWELALRTKQSYLAMLAKRRASLHDKVVPVEVEDVNSKSEIRNPKEGLDEVSQVQEIEISKTDFEEEIEESLEEIETPKEHSKVVFATDPNIEAQIIDEPDLVKVIEVVDKSIPKERRFDNPKNKQEDLDNLVRKPKRDLKVTTLGSIKVVGGGDVNHLTLSEQNAKMVPSVKKEYMNDEMVDRTKLASQNSIQKRDFIGKDFTKTVRSQKSGGLLSAILPIKAASTDPDGGFKKFKLTKVHYGIGMVILVLLMGLFYYMAFQSSNVRFTIELKKEEVDFQQKIIADADPLVTEVDSESLTIPAKELTEENLTTSKSGTATGKAKIGTKAKGFVTIYNKQLENDFTIKAGTKITSTATNKQYIIKSDVAMQAIEDDGGVVEVSIADDVPIEALEPGEDYNIQDSTNSNTMFVLEGYSSEDVEVKRFEGFEGGAAEEKTVVSQENIDKLKEIVNAELEEQGTNKLKAFVPSGYTLIEESIQYTEEKVESLPKVGEVTEDETFTLSLEAKITGIAVKEDDLEQMANIILSQGEDNEEEEFSVDSLEDISITEAVRDGTKLSFVISSSGQIKSVLDIEELKNEIKGNTLPDAENKILEREQVNNVRIRFSPSFVPDSLKRIPSDTSRIDIKLE